MQKDMGSSQSTSREHRVDPRSRIVQFPYSPVDIHPSYNVHEE